MTLKEGMFPIDWKQLSPKVQAHGYCGVADCLETAQFMKETRNSKGKYFKAYCEAHATKENKAKSKAE